ncbi:MerR family transcriptional regulator [Nocardia cyriacigeorgica]|uniref:DNA polymerase III subunit beta family protein n=1 Tax=Nocardia cyriacigeorgica TaxID=135487 RepID=UPI001895C6D2|nr:MerR family transcriptional regulator [Nocardia cyriacigeorgica]MBF6098183.1 MerR family transcriptional regulator [Nocardia cyriacigeorgica]MBF6343944.1 MerR family transcriptional regulator [Nocardia cyriacigeorgica]MBF6516901.1 MerR family transcriptional regulator [Nocardia cyriacigeorgica]
MTADRQLITIGVLARACGLTPSALRFYDDCGLLVPAEVDATTGYRYYTDDQRERAVLIRKLRDIGIGLDAVAAILSAESDEATRLLDEHVDAMARRAEEAAATAAAIKSELTALPRVSLPGALLAEAIGQVGSAVARDGEFRVLRGIFLEAAREAVVLTATDRYRLSTRTLVPRSWTGASWSRVVDADELAQAVPWMTAQADVALSPHADAVHLSSGGAEHRCATIEEQYPDYRTLLSELAPVRTRVIVGRGELIEAVESGADVLRVSARAGAVTVGAGAIRTAHHGSMPGGSSPTPAVTIPAMVSGPDTALAFARATLCPALTTAVGPDIMLDIAAPDLPVVIRSATDGDLTTLAMPTRLSTDSEENPA